jgi:hypothetical protein
MKSISKHNKCTTVIDGQAEIKEGVTNAVNDMSRK